jgi:hypothetical protein
VVVAIMHVSHSGASVAHDAAPIDARPLDAAPPDATPDAAIDAQLIDAVTVDAPLDAQTLSDRLRAVENMCRDHAFPADECAARRKEIMDQWDKEHR